jgi:hypothetical protein
MPSSPKALQQSYHAVHARADGVVNNHSIDGSRSDSCMVEKQGRGVIGNHVARLELISPNLLYACLICLLCMDESVNRYNMVDGVVDQVVE